MPCRPMAFSMPAGVSTMRGAGWPSRSVEEQSLDGDAAERREVDEVGVLDAVAEAAAGRDERVLERQRADANGEIHGRRISPTRSDRPASTGPARHERT